MASGLPWAFILGLAALMAGIYPLIWGLIGRRVGSTPFCVKCGFDLSGTIVGTPETRTFVPCPECGQDINSIHAVMRGVRVRNVRVIAIGSAMILCGAFVLGAGAYAHAKGKNLVASEPTWLLMAQADGSLGHASPPILAELLVREKKDTLGDANHRILIARALTAQADLSRAWDSQWGDLIAAGHQRGRTTDEQCRQFMQGAVQINVLMRDRVRTNFPTNLTGGASEGRAPSPSWSSHDTVLVRAQRYIATISKEGNALDTFDPNNYFDSEPGRFGHPCNGSRSQTHAWNVPPGEYTLKLDGEMMAGFRHMKFEDVGWKVTVSRNQRMVVTAAAAPNVQAVPSEAISEQLRTDLTLQIGVHLRDEWDQIGKRMVKVPAIEVSLDRTDPKLPLAFAGIIRDRDHPERSRTWQIDEMLFEPGISGCGTSLFKAGGFDCSHVDVVFKTSLDVAELSPTATRVWDGEIIFENVPIAAPTSETGSFSGDRPKVRPTRVVSPAPALEKTP